MAAKATKLDAKARLALLFDNGVYTELDASEDQAARIAFGSIAGATVYAYVEGGAQGFDLACARKLEKVTTMAERMGAPLVSVYDSNGVQLENGYETLDACSRILAQCSRISGVVPQVAVVAGTCAGFASLCATMADVTLMEEGAELFLTAPFLNETEEKNAGTAAFAEKAGVAAVRCEGEEALFNKARQVLSLLPLNNLSAIPYCEFAEPKSAQLPLSLLDGGNTVELFSGKGKSSKTYLGTLGGSTVGLVKTEGELCQGDSAKIARLVQLCDSYSIPVITLVDSASFLRSSENDQKAGIRNAAILTHTLAQATTPKIAVVTGKAIGSVFAVFCGKNAGSDMVYALPGAVISPLAPEAAVGTLWQDRIEKPADIPALAAEYAKTEANAENARKAGLVDRIVDASALRSALLEAVEMLASKRVTNLSKKHGNLPY